MQIRIYDSRSAYLIYVRYIILLASSQILTHDITLPKTQTASILFPSCESHTHIAQLRQSLAHNSLVDTLCGFRRNTHQLKIPTTDSLPRQKFSETYFIQCNSFSKQIMIISVIVSFEHTTKSVYLFLLPCKYFFHYYSSLTMLSSQLNLLFFL